MTNHLIYTVLKRQFINLRDGDRIWYQNILNEEEIRLIENVRLSDINSRNTQIGNKISDNVFRVSTTSSNRRR